MPTGSGVAELLHGVGRVVAPQPGTTAFRQFSRGTNRHASSVPPLERVYQKGAVS
jgi:hypothetical protein